MTDLNRHLQIISLTNRKKMSTAQIARLLKIQEYEVYNVLAKARGQLQPVKLVEPGGK